VTYFILLRSEKTERRCLQGLTVVCFWLWSSANKQPRHLLWVGRRGKDYETKLTPWGRGRLKMFDWKYTKVKLLVSWKSVPEVPWNTKLTISWDVICGLRDRCRRFWLTCCLRFCGVRWRRQVPSEHWHLSELHGVIPRKPVMSILITWREGLLVSHERK
jgi:hypothetical protein